MVSRAHRNPFANWWWTVDHMIMAALFALMLLGLLLAMAGGPPVAERLGKPIFYFFHWQLVYLPIGLGIMVATSLMSPRYVRRASLVIFVGAMVLIFAALAFGHEIKGSRRWIFGIQPSEFLKPAFVILAAWAFSQGASRRDVPGNLLAVFLLPLTIIPLMLQPDFGQTMLICIVWATLFFVAGLHWIWVGGIMGLGGAGAFLAYLFVPHVRARILAFMEPAAANGAGTAGTFQVDTAIDSIIAGGWLGKGPGEGTIKRILPDSHTDFIFAVTGEEFGIVACLIILGLFGFIVLRGLGLAMRNEDPFCRFAATGLLTLFGVQAAINMSVNLHLMPAKGMTLPFISYGGSSLVSLCLAMGFLVAVTRRRPRVDLAGYVDYPEAAR